MFYCCNDMRFNEINVMLKKIYYLFNVKVESHQQKDYLFHMNENLINNVVCTRYKLKNIYMPL